MIPLSRVQLLKELDDIRKVCEMPKLYLADYFSELRNQTDMEIVPKHLKETNPEKKTKLSNLWQTLIDKIDQYEKKFLSFKDQNVFLATLQKIDSLQEILNKSENIKSAKDLNELGEEIFNEKLNILKHLFQNETIALTKIGQINHFQLIIINDEYLDLQTFNNGYLYFIFLK